LDSAKLRSRAAITSWTELCNVDITSIHIWSETGSIALGQAILLDSIKSLRREMSSTETKALKQPENWGVNGAPTYKRFRAGVNMPNCVPACKTDGDLA